MRKPRSLSSVLVTGFFLVVLLSIGSTIARSQVPDGEAAEVAKGKEGPITKVGKDLINIRFTDESLENVVNIFTKMLGVNIIASPADLQGKNVTVNLKDAEWKPTLSAILDMHNFTLIEKTPGSGVYSIAVKAPDAAEPMVVETLFLDYKTVSEIHSLIESLLIPDARVLGFASGNAIVVKTTDANLGEIKQVIEKIDIPGKQVCVETKFMELSDEASKQLGIDWQMLKNLTIEGSDVSLGYGETRRKTTMDERGTVRTTVKGSSLVADFDAEAENVSQLSVDSDRTITRTSVLPLERVETATAILDVADFSVILSALNEMDGVNVISNPKIIVSSGATNAMFKVGERWPITRTTLTHRGIEEGVTDQVMELDTSISTDFIRNGYLETGIKLSVLPVVKTGDLIEAVIMPRLTRKIGTHTVGSDSWPIVSVKEITTTFTLRSGQTVAIGGLTSSKDEKKVSRIPLLGYIPLLGRLFSHTYEAQEQIETIIFVTLSLAEPGSLREEEGIPEEAELVHKKMLQSKKQKQKFLSDLKEMKKAADAEPENVEE